MQDSKQPELVERVLGALFAEGADGAPMFSREVLADAVPLTLLAFADIIPKESISASLEQLLEKFYLRAGVNDPNNAAAVLGAVQKYLGEHPLPPSLLERIARALETPDSDDADRADTERRFSRFLGASINLPEERVKNAQSPMLTRIKELDGRKKR